MTVILIHFGDYILSISWLRIGCRVWKPRRRSIYTLFVGEIFFLLCLGDVLTKHSSEVSTRGLRIERFLTFCDFLRLVCVIILEDVICLCLQITHEEGNSAGIVLSFDGGWCHRGEHGRSITTIRHFSWVRSHVVVWGLRNTIILFWLDGSVCAGNNIR